MVVSVQGKIVVVKRIDCIVKIMVVIVRVKMEVV